MSGAAYFYPRFNNVGRLKKYDFQTEAVGYEKAEEDCGRERVLLYSHVLAEGRAVVCVYASLDRRVDKLDDDGGERREEHKEHVVEIAAAKQRERDEARRRKKFIAHGLLRHKRNAQPVQRVERLIE